MVISFVCEGYSCTAYFLCLRNLVFSSIFTYSIKFLKPSSYHMHHYKVLPSVQTVYVLFIYLRTNSDFFPKQH